MSNLLVAFLVMAGTSSMCVLLIQPAKWMARRCAIMDEPGHRKIHVVPTPRTGGIAVFVSFIAVVMAGYFLLPLLKEQWWIREPFGNALRLLNEAHRVETKLLAVVFGSVCAFGIGLLDDIFGRRFPVGVKAAGQALAASVLVFADVRISFFPYEWMNIVLTLFWIVGITNAFNLLDNMDGLAAGVALVASIVLLINAWSLGEFFISLLLVAFIGSLIGFLIFNFNPASIFLGDCGSLFIGFLIGSLTLLERYVSHASSTLFPLLMPIVVLAVPLMDTTTVIVIRLREHRPIYVGDSRHLSHRLVSLGFSTRAAVLYIYLMTFCLGLGAAALTDATLGQSVLVMVQVLGFMTLVLVLMYRERRRAPREKRT